MSLSMFEDLHRRSVEQVERIVADGRRFDRQEIARIADVWADNTVPLFGLAGMRPGRWRDRKARQALRWMADMGTARRNWMIDSGGPGMQRLLGPGRPDRAYGRDHQGRLSAYELSLADAGLAGDYRLDAARVSYLRVERAGEALHGRVTLRVPRRYGEGDATIGLNLSGVEYVHFDSRDGLGVRLGASEVLLGSGGLLRAADVTAELFEDRRWHLSVAGRAADRIVPRRQPRRVPKPAITAPADARMLPRLEAWWRIRSIRYPGRVGRVPLAGLCDVLAGRCAGPVPDLANPGDRLPGGVWLTLASWTDEEPAVLVNYADPDQDRGLGSARFAGPVVISAGSTPGSLRSLEVLAG